MNIENKADKLNVLFLFHYSDLNNGAVRSMVDVIETLISKYKVNAIVVYPDNRGSAIDYLEKVGVKCYRIFYGRWDYKKNDNMLIKAKKITISLLKNIVGMVNIYKFNNVLKEEKINIIYSNTSIIYIGALLSKKYKLPHIWHIREFGKEDHGLGILFGEKNLYRALNNRTDSVIYISNSIRDKYCKFIKEKINQNIVYNDISPSFINPKIQFNMDINNSVNIAIIGSIQQGKGQLEVVKAIEICHNRGIDVRLHIGGLPEGKYYDDIAEYVESHKMKKYVHFDGFITDVNKYRRNMDIGVVASSNEAFGRVTVEGMLSDMAIIGANAAGTSELISNNETGLLYEVHNVLDLANKIEFLCLNRDVLRTLAESGFEYAKENFTRSKAAEEIYNIMLSTYWRRKKGD